MLWIEQKACELCRINNGSGCTTPVPDPNHWICKAWLAKARNSQPVSEEETRTDAELVAITQEKVNEYIKLQDAKLKGMKVDAKTIRWQCSGCDHLCALLLDTTITPETVVLCLLELPKWRKVKVKK